MIDVNAMKAQAALMSMGAAGVTNLPMITQKSDLNIQVQGLYSLLFNYIHLDFALRLETENAITTALLDHNGKYPHGGIGSALFPSLIKGTIMPIPMESIFPSGDFFIYNNSPVNSIGYGV